MNKFKKLMSLAMLATMVVNVPVTAYAAPESQTSQVVYRNLTGGEKNFLRQFFDAEYYAQQYPGVVAVYGNDPERLFDHFVKYGIFENRGSSKEFNASVYRACYPDLDAAFGDNMIAYYNHYVLFGKNENRELVTYEKAAEAGIVLEGNSGAVNPGGSGSGSSSEHAPVAISYVTTLYVHEETVIKNEPSESAPAVATLHPGDEIRVTERLGILSGDLYDGVQYYRLEDGRYARNALYYAGTGFALGNSIEEFPYGKIMVSVQETTYDPVNGMEHVNLGDHVYDTVEEAVLASTGYTWSAIRSDWECQDDSFNSQYNYIDPDGEGYLILRYGDTCPDIYYSGNSEFLNIPGADPNVAYYTNPPAYMFARHVSR